MSTSRWNMIIFIDTTSTTSTLTPRASRGLSRTRMRTFTSRYAIAIHTIRTCITATGIDGV